MIDGAATTMRVKTIMVGRTRAPGWRPIVGGWLCCHACPHRPVPYSGGQKFSCPLSLLQRIRRFFFRNCSIFFWFRLESIPGGPVRAAAAFSSLGLLRRRERAKKELEATNGAIVGEVAFTIIDLFEAHPFFFFVANFFFPKFFFFFFFFPVTKRLGNFFLLFLFGNFFSFLSRKLRM